MIIEEVKIADIKPYERNQKKHPESQVKNIAKSIEKYGFVQPIVIDKNNEIIIGHGRYMAGGDILGMETVPCVRAENLTDKQIRELRILDNKLNESDWDIDNLKLDLDELDFSDFEDLNFNLDFDLSEDDQNVIEDEAPEINENADPVAKHGQIYKLGNHRLMCGDSTNADDVNRLMNGNKADMVFTDPPYNLETKGGCKGIVGKALEKQGNDIEFIADFEPSKFLEVLPTAFEKNKMNAYVFCNKDLLPAYLNWAVENKYSYNVLIWKKPSALPIADSHRPDIEYLLLFRKNAIWNNSVKGVNYSRCLEFSRETGLHPTMKPIKLITNELEISSRANSNVLDLFGGSGSTLIACEQLERRCFMMELDPKYVDVIIQRWETFTGQKAELIN